MSESNAMPIPEDLKERYKRLLNPERSEPYNLKIAKIEAAEYIERIGRAEQRVQELEAALRGLVFWDMPTTTQNLHSRRRWENAKAALSKGAQPKEGA